MKYLFLGEYSNVHWTLAEGLRALGHEAIVVSDGDGWKNYKRDINLQRDHKNKWGALKYIWQLLKILPKFRGYDVVQVINPVFLELKPQRIWPVYKYLRRHNKHIVMAAYGMDKYWVMAGRDCITYKYSDFNIGNKERISKENQVFIDEWINGPKGLLNEKIAKDANLIIAGLWEYWACYSKYSPNQNIAFLPFPIVTHKTEVKKHIEGEKIKLFIGIQKSRNQYKGTDIMLRAAERIVADYPEKATLLKAENVPFHEYEQMMNNSDLLLDQLYSYTPAMNGLLAMSKGLVLVGGGEQENYDILGEQHLRPIINVQPTEESVYNELKHIILNPSLLNKLKSESKEYVEKHHEYRKVAQQYVKLTNSKNIMKEGSN